MDVPCQQGLQWHLAQSNYRRVMQRGTRFWHLVTSYYWHIMPTRTLSRHLIPSHYRCIVPRWTPAGHLDLSHLGSAIIFMLNKPYFKFMHRLQTLIIQLISFDSFFLASRQGSHKMKTKLTFFRRIRFSRYKMIKQRWLFLKYLT